MSGQRAARRRRRPWLNVTAAVGVLAALVVVSTTDPFGDDPQPVGEDVGAAPAEVETATDPAEPTEPTTTGPPLVTEGPTADPTPTRAQPRKKVRKGRSQDDLDRMLRNTVERQLRNSGQLLETTDGVLGEVTAPVGVPMDGEVSVSVANIPNTQADSRWYSSIGTLIAGSPDFVTLNEVYRHSNAGIEDAAPGYTVHRAAGPDSSPGASGQSQNNALLYRSDTWTMRAGGMQRIVDDDKGFLRGKPFVWDRFAVWAVLQNDEGQVISLISTHMPINPGKYPATHSGGPNRIDLFARGMDTVVAMVGQLSAYGPVLVGGDMNSHADQGGWTAAAKMGGAGYRYVKDQGVMYLFFGADADVVSSRQVSIYSDHPALLSTLTY